MAKQTKKQNKYIEDFLVYLELEKGRSRNTIQNYRFYLNKFFDFAKIAGPAQIDNTTIKRYRLWLNQDPQDPRAEKLSKSTQNYHLIALRSFLKYLSRQDIKSLAPEKIELAKMPERQIDFLDGDDLERLLEAPLKTDDKKIIQQRDKAILEMLFSTGLRVSELANLKRDYINLKKDEFTVRGKGSKLRVVFLSDSAKNWLGQYLNARADISPFLFVRHDKARGKKDPENLTPRSIQRMIKKYSLSAGITKEVTPHTMRHSFATDLLINGADIRSVQSMLGHSSITTTQIYTHLTNQQLKEVHKAFHQRKRRK